MKIVCESCGAKYSIADEKVAGKVFKIRCKRCSEVITVRGDQPAPAEEDPATRVYDYGPATAIWHVVVDGEQHGPYEPQQIAEMLSASQIDWDTYVWRDGFDDWVPARNVEELVQAVTGEAGAPAAQPQPAAAPASQPSMGADPFAGEAAAADAGGDLFGEPAAAQPAADPSGGGLFGGQPAAEPSPFGGEAPQDPGVVASSPGPRVSMDQAAMTGARNENSVLFSLKNLQALATGSEESGSAGSAPAQQQAGFASGEGSGLIDIRALAQATGVNKEGSNGQGNEKVDDLLSMGSSTGAFGSLGSPMLAPAAAEEKSSNKTLIFAILGGFGILAAAVVVAVVLLKSDAGPQDTQAVASGTPAAAASGADTDQGGGDQGGAQQAAAAANENQAEDEKAEEPEPESEGAKAAKQAAEKEGQDEKQRASERERERRRSARRSGSREERERSKRRAARSSSSSQKKEEPEPQKTQKRSGSSGGDDIDSLLSGAIGGGGQKQRSAQRSSPKANLPKTPSRSQVLSALRRIQPAVSACAKGKSGVAMTAITVDGSSGRVKSAQVSGSFAGTPVGSCVARAVRKARFPKFSKSSFTINFPFKL